MESPGWEQKHTFTARFSLKLRDLADVLDHQKLKRKKKKERGGGVKQGEGCCYA